MPGELDVAAILRDPQVEGLILGIGAAVVLFIVLQFVQPERIMRPRRAAEPPDRES